MQDLKTTYGPIATMIESMLNRNVSIFHCCIWEKL